MTAHIPLRKQRHFAPEQRLVVRRQRAGARRELPAQQRVGRIAHQSVGIVLVEGLEVRAGPKVGEQQEPLCQILGVDLGCIDARPAQQLRNVYEGAAILLARRCVHRDVAAAVGQAGAEIAPEARVLGRWRQGESRVLELRCKPAP